MNLWHTHEPPFDGTHTHELQGSNVEHAHSFQGGDDIGPVIEVVTVFGKRYKQPKIVDPDAGHDGELAVDGMVAATGTVEP